ncbi:hypothetical protein SporoP37_03115 [Sporosarcina sp. P37]|uniref:hypothetical protein n=1 Tax=unclassified Sporosarcina TaxID=2647733 RepID=UPI000A17E74A|nr:MULTISPECIES: hypothetical protein [unclassified Sporosarcina]ARK23787.1 hypothetical protein SporoP37_03115 [Sporosarcina sp. P37]PID18933.1 hypothetical protein CSV62_06100 [Sporosarcina sp. P35]
MTYYLSKYAKCRTKEELDAAARRHGDIHFKAMNKTDRAVLDMIRCYSVKYLAAHLKHETIEKKVGVSNSTVRRSLRKLEKLQIIERIAFIRPVMNGLGANIYSILPVADQSEMNSPEKSDARCNKGVYDEFAAGESSFLKTKKTAKKIKTSHLADEKLSSSLFSRMKNLLALTGDTSKARELFIIHRSLSGRMLRFDIHRGKKLLFEELAYRAAKISVMATKTKNIRNVAGYYSGVLRQLLSDALFKEIHEEYSVPVEELYRLTH